MYKTQIIITYWHSSSQKKISTSTMKLKPVHIWWWEFYWLVHEQLFFHWFNFNNIFFPFFLNTQIKTEAATCWVFHSPLFPLTVRHQTHNRTIYIFHMHLTFIGIDPLHFFRQNHVTLIVKPCWYAALIILHQKMK